MAVTYLRLFPAVNQFELRNGQLNTAGRLKVFFEGTDDLADLYDENGSQLQQPVVLDDNGRARGLFVDSKKVYRLEVYDCYGQLLYTVRKMVPSGGGTGSALGKVYDVVSNDGSILVDKFDEGGTTTFDLSLGIDANELKPSCLSASAAPVTTDGQFVFDQLVREGNLLSVDQSGKVRMEPAWYHFTAIVELSYDGTPVNEAHQVTLWTTLSNSVIDLDTSYAHRESIELSGDIHVVGNNTEFPLGVSGLDMGITASLMSFDIHAVTGHEGNNEYHAGEGINIVNATKTISADFDSVQEKLVAGNNISITGNVISAGNLSQEQADWTEDDTESPAYIKNKPDLDVYATQAQLTYGLAGKQDVISDLAQIRAGATAGSSAVQPADLAAVATTGDYNDLNNRPNLTVYATKTEVNTGLAAKQDVIDDLSDIRSGAQAGSTAVQPGDLATVATTGSYDDLVDKPSIPAAQVNSDWDATSGVTAILNRPNLATVATTGDYTDLVNKPSIPAAQVNADWDATSGVEQILNRPNLATVATTGDYNDLVNTPVIPSISVTDVEVDGTSVVNAQGVAEITMPTVPTKTSDLQNDSGFITLADVPAQENADWDSTSGASEILHKPDLSIYAQSSSLATVATTGDYDDLIDKPDLSIYAQSSSLATVATTGNYADLTNTPSIPAAQVNADWDATSGVSQILNRPNLATVATTGAYSDLTGTPTINNVPAVTSSDNDKVLKASYSGGVGSYSWQTEQAPISAGTGISITNNVVSVDNTVAMKSDLPAAYTAGDGISVANNEISAKAGTGLEISDVSETTTDNLVCAAMSSNWAYDVCPMTQALADAMNTSDGYTFTLAKPFDTDNNYVWPCIVKTSELTQGELQHYAFFGNYLTTYTPSTDGSWHPYEVSAGTQLTLKFSERDQFSTVTVADILGDLSNYSLTLLWFDEDSPYAAATMLSTDMTPETTATHTATTTLQDALCVSNPLPASTVADADKVLKVNSSGAPEWTTGGGDDGADWDAEQGEPGYIENKPVPKTLTAGTGISITENASTITIANTVTPPTVDQTYDASSTHAQSGAAVADAIGNLGTNLSVAQIQALKEALGVDETVLYSGMQTVGNDGVATYTLSESPLNFQYIKVYFCANDNTFGSTGNIGSSYTEWDTQIYTSPSTFLTVYMDGNASATAITKYAINCDVSGIQTSTWSAHGYLNDATTNAKWFHIYKIVGRHRIASN